MTDSEKAKLLLQLLDQAAFAGKERHAVMELAAWLEAIREERIICTESK